MTTSRDTPPLEPEDQEKIKRYLSVNASFWEQFESKRKQHRHGTILVDMMTTHPGYLMTKAITAKYLQHHLKVPIIAVLWQTTGNMGELVAKSYGIGQRVYLNQQTQFSSDWPSYLASLKEAACTPDIRAARKQLLSFRYQDILLGDLAYDTYLRNSGNGSVFRPDEEVFHYFEQTLRNFLFFSKLIEQTGTVAVVVGHTVYAGYGTMVRAALKKQIPVYSVPRISNPLPLKKYQDLSQMREYELRIPPDLFDAIYKRSPDKCIQRGKMYIEKRFTGHEPYQYILSYDHTRKRLPPEEFRDQFHLDQRRLVCIMSHIFPDAPHKAESLLFNDYYEWLEETLYIAADIKDVIWLVKEHPDLRHYHSNQTAEQLVASFSAQYDHIRFLSGEINTASLFHVTHALVTVTGTAALEFATLGVPVIIAGKSFYCGYGFTYSAKSQDQYRDLLHRCATLEPLTDEQVRRACAFSYVFNELIRVPCSFIPDIVRSELEKIDVGEFYDDATRRLQQNCIEDDPFFVNFNRFMSNGDRLLMNYQLLEEITS